MGRVLLLPVLLLGAVSTLAQDESPIPNGCQYVDRVGGFTLSWTLQDLVLTKSILTSQSSLICCRYFAEQNRVQIRPAW